MLGERGGKFSKMCMYESSIRIPFVLSFPASGLGENLVDDRLVEATDVLPTLVTLAGGEVPGKLHGRSLVAVENGAVRLSDTSSWRAGAFAEYVYHYDNVKTKAYVEKPVWMWRTQKYKLIVKSPALITEAPAMELYDLENDPGEVHNLSEQPEMKGVCERMLNQLLVHIMDSVSV